MPYALCNTVTYHRPYDVGYMEDESTERVERRYIGTFSIPFATIYREERIEGVFRLNTPVFNFGYDHNLHGFQKSSKGKSKMFEEEEFDVDNDEGGIPTISVQPGFFNSMFRSVYSMFDSATAAATAAAVAAAKRRAMAAETGDNTQLIHRETQVGSVRRWWCSVMSALMQSAALCTALKDRDHHHRDTDTWPGILRTPGTLPFSYPIHVFVRLPLFHFFHFFSSSLFYLILFCPSPQTEFDYYASAGAATYLKLMITLDPILVTPPIIPDEINSGNLIPEDRFCTNYARQWMREIASVGAHTKNRSFSLFGMRSNGLHTLIPRFLTALKPPKGFDSKRACVHLASQVPFMPDAQVDYRSAIYLMMNYTSTGTVSVLISDTNSRSFLLICISLVLSLSLVLFLALSLFLSFLFLTLSLSRSFFLLLDSRSLGNLIYGALPKR